MYQIEQNPYLNEYSRLWQDNLEYLKRGEINLFLKKSRSLRKEIYENEFIVHTYSHYHYPDPDKLENFYTAIHSKKGITADNLINKNYLTARQYSIYVVCVNCALKKLDTARIEIQQAGITEERSVNLIKAFETAQTISFYLPPNQQNIAEIPQQLSQEEINKINDTVNNFIEQYVNVPPVVLSRYEVNKILAELEPLQKKLQCKYNNCWFKFFNKSILRQNDILEKCYNDIKQTENRTSTHIDYLLKLAKQNIHSEERNSWYVLLSLIILPLMALPLLFCKKPTQTVTGLQRCRTLVDHFRFQKAREVARDILDENHEETFAIY